MSAEQSAGGGPDPVAALAVAWLAVREGREAWHGELACDDRYMNQRPASERIGLNRLASARTETTRVTIKPKPKPVAGLP
jgi:hypothetical protein